MDFPSRYGPMAMVTGASAGLGLHYAHQLAAKGMDLCLVARRLDRLEELAENLRGKYAIEVLCCAVDLTSPDAISTIQEAVGHREIGLLVANAGFGAKGAFLEADADTNAQMIQLNCVVPVLMAHAFLPPMVARGRGGMIVLASTAAYQATPFMSVYGATKVFDLHWSEGLTQELRGTGVDVLAICPGSTDTEFHAVAGGVATGLKMAKPEDVVRLSLQRLPRGGSTVHGWWNRVMSFGNRFAPRRLSAAVAARLIQDSQERA
jgi:short-subunit dehydrogenase